MLTVTIEHPGDVHRYTFDGEAGNVIYITAVGTADAPWLALKVEVSDPGGQPVSEEFRNKYRMLSDGRYTIQIQDAGTRTGSYVLKLLAEDSAGRIRYGDVVTGTMTRAGEEHFFSFAGEAGDRVQLWFNDSRWLNQGAGTGRATVEVSLLDPQGESIAYGDNWVTPGVIEHILTASGECGLRVRITGHLGSPTTGSYLIRLKNLSPNAGTRLHYGDTVTGQIKFWYPNVDVYVFDWTTSEVPVIEATQTAGGGWFQFTLNVEVFDSQGNSLAVGSFAEGQTTVKPALTESGTYVIRVEMFCAHSGNCPRDATYSLSLRNLS